MGISKGNVDRENGRGYPAIRITKKGIWRRVWATATLPFATMGAEMDVIAWVGGRARASSSCVFSSFSLSHTLSHNTFHSREPGTSHSHRSTAATAPRAPTRRPEARETVPAAAVSGTGVGLGTAAVG